MHEVDLFATLPGWAKPAVEDADMELIHTLLLEAIAGETAAEARYKAFAARAKEERYFLVAALFMALSRAEGIHIANHLRALEKNSFTNPLPKVDVSHTVHSTAANLKVAIAAEKEEFQNMYPEFRKRIGKYYGNAFTAKIAKLSIQWARDSEANHHKLLEEALQRVELGRDVEGGDYYLCSVCGNIVFSGRRPEKLCLVCGHDVSFYTPIRV